VRVLVALSVVAAAATLASPAQAARSYVYDPELADIARESLRRTASPPVRRAKMVRFNVRCYLDKRAFEQTFEARFGLSARRVIAYYAGGNDLHLRNGTCDNVQAFIAGRHTVYTAASYAILLHEALHRQGVRDERITTCLANDAVRGGALWLGFDDERALRARNLAFTYMRLYTPPEYRMGKPNCLLLNRRTDWVDHRIPSR
jgi:hypothetical protein